MATCLWEAGFAVTDPGDAICSEDWAPNKLFGGGEYSFGITVRQWLRNALNATDASPCKLADIRPGECEFQVRFSRCFCLAKISLEGLDNSLMKCSAQVHDVPTGGLFAAHGVDTSRGLHGVQQPHGAVNLHGRHRCGLCSTHAESGACCQFWPLTSSS